MKNLILLALLISCDEPRVINRLVIKEANCSPHSALCKVVFEDGSVGFVRDIKVFGIIQKNDVACLYSGGCVDTTTWFICQ